MKFQNIGFYCASLMALIFGLQSCQIDPCGSAPADLIENMEDLVKEVKRIDYMPKDERWQSYDNRFEAYFEDCYDLWSPDMTGNQKRKFFGLVTQYLTNRFGRSFFRSIFGDKEGDKADSPEFFDKLSEELEKLLEENKKSGKQFFENLMNEARDAINRDSKNK